MTISTPLHHSDLRRRRRAQRGLAFVEGVLILPLWLVLFAGFAYATKSSLLRLHLRSDARSCAHRAALSGCAAPPADCREVERAASEEGGKEVRSTTSSLGRSTSISGPTEGALDEALNLLTGERVRYGAKAELPGPILLGAATKTSEVSVRMPCVPLPLAPPVSGKETLSLLGGF